MGASATLSQPSAAVDPGGQATVEIKVKNTGTVVDQFAIEVLGDTSAWATADPPTLSLFPDAEGTARVVFRPPRTSSVHAGTQPFGVMVRSHEDPQGSVVEEGTLQIGPFFDSGVELIPRTSRGSRGGRHDLALDNRGNVTLQAALEASDPDKLVRFEFDPPSAFVDPGQAGFAKVRVKPNQTFWRGLPKSHPFQVVVQPEGGSPLTADGNFLQEAILPPWFMRALIALIALVVGAVLLWLLVLQPSMKSSAEQALKDFGFTPQPGSSAAGGGGGGGGGASPSPTAGPSPSPEVSASPSPSPAGSASPGASAPASPTPTPVQVSPPPVGVQAPVAGRLDQTQSALKPGGTLFITDLVFSNPTGASGDLILQRDAEQLLVLRLDNFRDLDFHFVTPITVNKGQTLRLVPKCTTACAPAVFYSGYVQTP